MITTEPQISIEREGKAALIPEIIVKPELPIGTELWFMRDNKPTLALVASFHVHVTAMNHNKDQGLFWQLFSRWLNKKAKEYYNYSYNYSIKIDGDIQNHSLDKKNGSYFIYDKQCFPSKEQLMKSL